MIQSASTIRERLAVLARNVACVGSGDASRRVKWWGKTYFSSGRDFERWCRSSGAAGSDELRRLVELGDAGEAGEGADSWRELRSAALADPSWIRLARDEAARQQIGAELGLQGLGAPFVLHGRNRFRRLLATAVSRGLACDATAMESSLVGYLRSELAPIGLPTATLAINVRRVRQDLTGDTSEARAARFAETLLTEDGRAQVIGGYPVVDRIMAEITGCVIDAVEELLNALLADRTALEAQFKAAKGKVTDIQLGLGDAHVGGRTVACVKFEGGSLIYKPRPLGADIAYNDLLDWMQGHLSWGPRGLKSLARGQHGWVEFVEHQACKNLEGVRLCYRRIGALLAVHYMIGGSDLHYENLICRGDEPFVVDLETLFGGVSKLYSRAGHGQRYANRAWAESLQRIGYFPSRMAVGDNVIDLSAAGLVMPQTSPLVGHMYQNNGRDDAKSVETAGEIRPKGNVVKVGETVHAAREHIESLVQGFGEAYTLLVQERETLLAEGGLLEAFRGVTVRFVPQATVIYATTLHDSFHPSFMRDGIEHELAFARLRRGRRGYDALLVAEARDLWRGDIPYFSVGVDSTNIVTTDGSIIADILVESGFSAMVRRLRTAGVNDVGRHARLMSKLLQAGDLQGGPTQPGDPVVHPVQPIEREDLLAGAREIGERLLADMEIVEGWPHWMAMTLAENGRYAVASVGEDFYGGAAGMGVFFAELWHATGDGRFRGAARACRRMTRAMRGGRSGRCIGAYEGLAGLIYAELLISDLIGGLSTAFINRTMGRIARMVENDTHLDVIGGASGALLVALQAASEPACRENALTVARLCGDHLLAHARRDAGCATWLCEGFDAPVSGLSHGAAGIAYALASLTAATGDDAYAQLAWEALRFESTTYDAKAETWQDVRPGKPVFCQWCHGAAGMTLARIKIAALGLASAPDLGPDIAIGLQAIARRGGGGSHCLCHGSLGNVETLIEAARADPCAARPDVIAGLVATTCQQRRSEGAWRCGLASYAATEGLLVGLSGIGLGLLRVRDPTIPCVLSLDRRRPVAWGGNPRSG